MDTMTPVCCYNNIVVLVAGSPHAAVSWWCVWYVVSLMNCHRKHSHHDGNHAHELDEDVE